MTKNVDYDPKTEARIRVYNSNGNATTKVLNDTSCQDLTNKSKKGISRNPFSRDNIHNDLLRRTLKNISVGMPLTNMSEEAINSDEFTDTVSFTEQVITAGKLAVVRGSQFYVYSCEIRGEFMPEAGKDYEVSYDSDHSTCRMYINELEATTSSTSKATAKLGKEVPYQKCIN
ncbi:hypothetical protein [Actinobacillus vicugnae]|uniref:hypothetical protein n=1 Tax=Actinobacillus vicugnae TaxID=2573093 RepID=UPI001241C1CA|nr:hypothetical protein [Actinobacillus vicugnae]